MAYTEVVTAKMQAIEARIHLKNCMFPLEASGVDKGQRGRLYMELYCSKVTLFGWAGEKDY